MSNRVFVSPDVGNVKRAQVYANKLGGEICIIDKRRKSGSETKAMHIIGDVSGKNVLMVDDMITTAGTVTEACEILRDNGAKEIYIAATHAVFAAPAMERLAECAFHETGCDRHDSDRHPVRCDQGPRSGACGVAELLGEAIHRIHHNESVSALFEETRKSKERNRETAAKMKTTKELDPSGKFRLDGR